MRNQLTLSVMATLLIVIAMFCCQPKTNREDKKSGETNKITDPIIDTAYFFVRTILNASPKQVAKKLGNPDQPLESSNDCVVDNSTGVCSQGFYQNRKYYVEYSNDRLKYLEMPKYESFDNNLIQELGFPKSEPTFAGPQFIKWSGPLDKLGKKSTGPLIPIPGIILISVFHDSADGNLVHIYVENNYNKRF
jgi:hypothetical protein